MPKEILFVDPKKALEQKDAAARYNDISKNLDRSQEIGLVNEQTGSSVTIKKDGEISLSSDEMSQFRIGKNKSVHVAQEHHAVHNRVHLETDELIINNHKLNPQLVELSDTRVLFSDPNEVIGNLMMDGTVMVKAWEPNLQKYVLVRRRIRTPMFSYKLNQPIIPDQLNLDVGMMTAVDLDAAILIKEQQKAKNKVVLDEHAAEGGGNYDQGDYNNYTGGFVYGENSMTNMGGMSTGSTQNATPEFVEFNSTLDYIWPVPSSFRITSYFGSRKDPLNPNSATQQFHNGIDIGASNGTNTVIVASSDGQVIKACYENVTTSGTGYKNYGRLVHIGHSDGNSTLYAHLDRLHPSVTEGGTVQKGQIIGYMGSTGASTGIHLHFTICKSHSPHDFNTQSKLVNPSSVVKAQN